jgi:hypothetical protein
MAPRNCANSKETRGIASAGSALDRRFPSGGDSLWLMITSHAKGCALNPLNEQMYSDSDY